MTNLMIDVFTLSILIAGIIGVIRYKQVPENYYPFIYLIWLGCLNEIISFTLAKFHLYTIINNNVYVLMEAMLLTWFFKKNGLFLKAAWLYTALLITFFIGWCLESFVLRNINELSLYFRIAYSFIVVLMSIQLLNEQLSSESGNILKNALFLICMGLIIFFTFKVMINSFWLYGLSRSRKFLLDVTVISFYIDLLTNLIFAFAILWAPKKQLFTRLL